MGWLDLAGSVNDRCQDSFGEPVTYTPSGGSPVETVGIFDNEHQEVDPNTGAVVTSSQPILGVKEANLPQLPQQEDTLSVRGKTYRVLDVHPDGQGGSKLLLHEI